MGSSMIVPQATVANSLVEGFEACHRHLLKYLQANPRRELVMIGPNNSPSHA